MATIKSKFGHTVDLAPVTLSNGKSTMVAKGAAANIQGFLRDLEATGYKIKSLGGFADRANVNNPNEASKHAYGLSIDINPEANQNRQSGTDMPVAKVQELIKKWDLGWGLNWKSVKDPMHFSAAKNEGGFIDPKTMQGDSIPNTTQAVQAPPIPTTPFVSPFSVSQSSPTPTTQALTEPMTILQGTTGLIAPSNNDENTMFANIAQAQGGGLEQVYAEAAQAIASAKSSVQNQPMIQSTNPLRAELSSIFDSVEI